MPWVPLLLVRSHIRLQMRFWRKIRRWLAILWVVDLTLHHHPITSVLSSLLQPHVEKPVVLLCLLCVYLYVCAAWIKLSRLGFGFGYGRDSTKVPSKPWRVSLDVQYFFLLLLFFSPRAFFPCSRILFSPRTLALRSRRSCSASLGFASRRRVAFLSYASKHKAPFISLHIHIQYIP